MIYNEDNGISHAFQNPPGVDLLKVDRMNQPLVATWGGSAYSRKRPLKKLNALWGKRSSLKSNYNLGQGRIQGGGGGL